MKTVFLTNSPAPYREKMHEITYKKLNGSYRVIYCANIEPHRKWSFPKGNYRKTFLKTKPIKLGSAYTYLWSNIISVLKKEKPKVIIIGGLSLPMILSFFWAKFNNCKIIALSDATIQSEKTLTFLHKLLRIFFYKKMDAYIGISQKTIKLFKSYEAKKNKCFISPLSIDNVDYRKSYKNYNKRKYDILLCGRFVPIKLFDFSIDVISQLYKEKKNLLIKVVGDGPLRNQIISRLNSMSIKYKYSGFIQPSLLKKEYASAKLFLFPTLGDKWGVVANESCAAGTPVITCDNAGVANELIRNNFNGYILKLNTNLWKEKIKVFFNNKKIMNKMSKNALQSVEKFDSKTAAKGIIDAIQFVDK